MYSSQSHTHQGGEEISILLLPGREGRISAPLCSPIPELLSDVFQAAFMNKKVKVGERMVNLSIWDTAGQERFHALGPIYYRDAQGKFSPDIY